MTGAMLLLVSVILTMTSCGDGDGADIEPSIASSTPNGEPHEPFVATYFYYWYDLPDGPHSTELTDRPAEQSASYESIGGVAGAYDVGHTCVWVDGTALASLADHINLLE